MTHGIEKVRIEGKSGVAGVFQWDYALGISGFLI
jgi:hypothetical protein